MFMLLGWPELYCGHYMYVTVGNLIRKSRSRLMRAITISFSKMLLFKFLQALPKRFPYCCSKACNFVFGLWPILFGVSQDSY